MCSRHAPTDGADSQDYTIAQMDSLQGDPEIWERPFRVLLEEELGSRFWLTVRAIGPSGARLTAIETAIGRGWTDVTALAVEEVVG